MPTLSGGDISPLRECRTCQFTNPWSGVKGELRTEIDYCWRIRRISDQVIPNTTMALMTAATITSRSKVNQKLIPHLTSYTKHSPAYRIWICF